MIPSWETPTPNSSSAQSMPSDSTPRILLRLILNSWLRTVGVEHRSDFCAKHLETLPAVCSPANDRQRLALAHIDPRDVQVVRVGMVLAGQHLADHDPLQAAAHPLDLLETLHFESDIGQDHRELFGRKVGVQIASEPVIRNVHIRMVNVFPYPFRSGSDTPGVPPQRPALPDGLCKNTKHSRNRAAGIRLFLYLCPAERLCAVRTAILPCRP